MEQRLPGKPAANQNPFSLIFSQPQTNSTPPFWFNSPNMHIAGLLPLLNGTLSMPFLPQVPNVLDQMAIAYQLQQLNNSPQIRNLALMRAEGVESAQRQMVAEQPKLAIDFQPKPLKIQKNGLKDIIVLDQDEPSVQQQLPKPKQPTIKKPVDTVPPSTQSSRPKQIKKIQKAGSQNVRERRKRSDDCAKQRENNQKKREMIRQSQRETRKRGQDGKFIQKTETDDSPKESRATIPDMILKLADNREWKRVLDEKLRLRLIHQSRNY